MPYNAVATSQLNCRDDNLRDYHQAKPGQWFVGVLDTHNRAVYMLPIDVQGSRGARSNEEERSHNRYASGVLASTPGSEDSMGQVVNVHQTTPWESCSANWLTSARGSTTHEKVQITYDLDPANLLGFSLIKIGDGTAESGGGFAILKCSSNTMNMRAGPDDDDCGFPTHSFSRSTHLKVDTTGTTQMPKRWSDALLSYFQNDVFYIRNCIKSND